MKRLKGGPDLLSGKRRMGRTERYFNLKVFALVSALLCILYSFAFSPITYEAQGDFPAYLDLAKQIWHIDGAPNTDLSHRSPLYSIIMGLFYLVFGESHYLLPLMVFHYALIFLSSVIAYKIILHLSGNTTAAFVGGLAGIINLTTIFFGFLMISETVALFLFTVTVWLLLRFLRDRSYVDIVMAGLTTGMLILARFNMLGLPLVIAGLILLMSYLGGSKEGVFRGFISLIFFTVSLFLIVNLWAFRNYVTSGRYELIPKHHTGQRWAVPATISDDDVVSDEYRGTLEIFLKTREALLSKEKPSYRKSSLLEYDIIEKINDYFRPAVSGYLLYRDSEDELLGYYNLEKTPEGIRTLNTNLKPFYEEIAAQNNKEIRRLRVYSFIYSFKHISPTLPGDKSLNLNILPSVVLRAYKVLFIVLVVLTYAASLMHSLYLVTGKERFRHGLKWLGVYAAIWYFPVINCYANVLSDANRFRYPADLLIIGIFSAFVFSVMNRKVKPSAA